MADKVLQTAQRVTFTSIATILIPIGVGFLTPNFWFGVVIIGLGIGALVLREVFKTIE